MKKVITIICVIILGATMSIYDLNGGYLDAVYNLEGESINAAYNLNGYTIFTSIPLPAGDLNASNVILLPDLYEEGKGFTCTGLTYDETTNTFLVGEIGALLPGEQVAGSIVRVTRDFASILETIPISSTNSKGLQGVTIDTSDNTIYFCNPNDNKIWHISGSGTNLGSIRTPKPNGIAYNDKDDTFWVTCFDKNIRHITKSGTVLKTIAFAYDEPLDQCFLDKHRGLLYITAGTNYSGRNNVYCLNINTEEQYIACTVDSYSVEGIWLGDTDKMIILNDGYYHSAAVPYNQANIYTIE